MHSWQRTVRVLWLVQFLTTLAMNLGLTFVPFFLERDPRLAVTDPAARQFYTYLILAGPFFTTILCTPLWGWVADRTGPKRQVVRACVGQGLTQILIALAPSAEAIVVIRMVQGMVSGVLAACLGLTAVVTPKEKQGSAIAMLQSATPAGQLLAPPVGDLLVELVGFRGTYMVLGLLIVLTGALSWWLLRQDGFVPAASANPFVALWRGFQRALIQPTARQALAVLFIGQFAFAMAQGVMSIYAARLIEMWVSKGAVELAWWSRPMRFAAIGATVTGVASVCSASAWGKLQDRGVRWLTPAGAILLALAMLTLATWPPWWAVLLARAAVGVGVGGISTLQYAALSRRAAPADRNQLLAVATSLNHAGNLCGFVLGGLMAGGWAESSNFALAAGAYVLVALMAARLATAPAPASRAASVS